jgi:hypothetical protein
MATAAQQRKVVVEATRGALIAVYAAAGLARKQATALRLLRAAEGLCRTAVAVLQTDGGTETDKGTGAGKDKQDTGKGKNKDSNEGKDTQQKTGTQPRRRRRRASAAAAPDLEDVELDDAWADGVNVAPAASGIALPGRDAPAAVGPVAVPGVVPPPTGEEIRQRRPLVARRSGTRSPRAKKPLPDNAWQGFSPVPLSPVLQAGRVATIRGLVSRPELEDVLVVLDECDKRSGRWICHTKGGEQLRILPEKLVPIAENGQEFMRLRFGKS